MLQFPGSGSGYTPQEGEYPLTVGTHLVSVAAIKWIASSDRFVVEYRAQDGLGFFSDWLVCTTDASSKRSFAYLARLHELAGLPVPKGGAFDEQALIGTKVALTLAEEEYDGVTRVKAASFPAHPSTVGVETASGF